MHNRHEQFGFYFLIFNLKTSKQEHYLIIPGAKAETFGAKKEIASVPYFNVLETLLKSLFCVLRLCGNFMLILETSPIIADKNPLICFYIFIALAWLFLCCTEKKTSLARSYWHVDLWSTWILVVFLRAYCWFCCLGFWSEISRLNSNN